MLKPDRRNFLKLSGMAGVATTLKFAVGRAAWQCAPSPANEPKISDFTAFHRE